MHAYGRNAPQPASLRSETDSMGDARRPSLLLSPRPGSAGRPAFRPRMRRSELEAAAQTIQGSFRARMQLKAPPQKHYFVQKTPPSAINAAATRIAAAARGNSSRLSEIG